MQDVAVIEESAAAVVALDPIRSRMLAALAAHPASAAGVAARLGLPRQKAGYHLKALEDQGLVVEVEQRRHGGLTERVYAATASTYLVSPSALGPAGADPKHVPDRLSAAYLAALAGRAVREVGSLLTGAAVAGKRLPTLSLDTDIRFRSAADRAQFADELGAAVRVLAARYHDESAPNGRWYRFVSFAHPKPKENTA